LQLEVATVMMETSRSSRRDWGGGFRLESAPMAGHVQVTVLDANIPPRGDINKKAPRVAVRICVRERNGSDFVYGECDDDARIRSTL
jgi:hypothetical protein